MDEGEMVETMERVIGAWNRGDLDRVTEEITEDFEFDCTHSAVPGLTDVYKGLDGYQYFSNTWRGTMGPTRLELVEGRKLDDGRFFAHVRQLATGPQSGVDVETTFVQIMEFEGKRTSRAELYGDPDQGRAAAGLG